MPFRMTMLTALAALAFGLASAAEPPLTTQVIATGLTKPLLVTHAPGDYSRIFIVEQTGKIKIRKNGVILPTPFLDVQPLMGGSETYLEYGLLGLAFHPAFAQNGYFYVMYTTGNSNLADPVIYRYQVSANPDVALSLSASLVLRINYTQKQHRSGWMEFGPDGYFYCATGDGGENDPTNSAADLSNLRGKILRLDVDGLDNIPGNGDDDAIIDPNRNYSIPPDNPFVSRPGAMGEIWHYGLRNPWRDSFDAATGDLYIGDVGQVQKEEVSFAAAGVGGLFFGWRCWEGTSNTGLSCGSPAESPTPPIHDYPRTVGISVTGGYVYRGCAIPELGGTYFFGDWSGGKIFSFRYSPLPGVTGFLDRTATLGGGGGLTSFGSDAYGEIYYTRGSGEVRKIVPVSAQGPDCNGNSIRDACDLADGSSSDANGNQVPDECDCASAPAGRPVVQLGVADGTAVLSWTSVPAASAYDIVRGVLSELAGTSGDFSTALDNCIEDDHAATSIPIAETPAVGDGYFFLVRAVSCGGAGSYDNDDASQVAPRDVSIAAAPEACP